MREKQSTNKYVGADSHGRAVPFFPLCASRFFLLCADAGIHAKPSSAPPDWSRQREKLTLSYPGTTLPSSTTVRRTDETGRRVRVHASVAAAARWLPGVHRHWWPPLLGGPAHVCWWKGSASIPKRLKCGDPAPLGGWSTGTRKRHHACDVEGPARREAKVPYARRRASRGEVGWGRGVCGWSWWWRRHHHGRRRGVCAAWTWGRRLSVLHPPARSL